MNQATIMARTQDIFRDIFDDESLTIGPQTCADDIEDWDSLNHINLVASIQREFGIRFKLGELEALQNVGEMIELIVQKLHPGV